MSQVQEASERMRIADSYGIDLASMLTCEGIDPQLPRDLVTLMRAHHAEHLPDDDLPIDNDFLRSLGFVHREGGHELTLALGCIETIPQFTNREGNRRWSIGSGNWRDVLIPRPLCPKNRGDVRRLLRQLRIEFKEGCVQ